MIKTLYNIPLLGPTQKYPTCRSWLQGVDLFLLLRLGRGILSEAVVALDICNDLLHLRDLFFPLFGRHLGLLIEELHIRLSVRTEEAVPEGRILAVIVVEVEVMHCVAGGAVDDRGVGNVFTVVC